MKKWESLPDWIRQDEVKPYYDSLSKKKFQLFLKRFFDILIALLLTILLSPVMFIISIRIKFDSKGPVFYRQVRVTRYGREFRIHKFRTMVVDADQKGTLVTVDHDSRITKSGQFLRKHRLDEIPQLFDVLDGNMSFVGTRPEVKKYVDQYTPEMRATLLLPAGITSEASIEYKDEDELLKSAKDADQTYVNVILPAKMRYNLASVMKFSLAKDWTTMIRTVFAVK